MASTRVKLFLTAGAAATLFLGCAEVPSTGPAPPDLRAEFRFVHAAPELGDVQVSVDGVAQGTLGFAASTPYANYPAGSRAVTLSNGESQFVAMSTDLRGTIALLPAASGAAREFFRLTERRIFDAPATALRVINFNPAHNVVVNLTAASDTVASMSLGYKASSGYRALNAGNYTIVVKAADRDTVLASAAVAVSTSQTTMILGNGGTVVLANLTDN